MTPQDFQQMAELTAVKSYGNKMRIAEKDFDLLHAGMGLSTESGEFMDQLKRHFFYGKELDEVNLQEELGDVMWYIGFICQRMGWSLADIMAMNIEKLKVRFPEAFNENDALNRDLSAERNSLENNQSTEHKGA